MRGEEFGGDASNGWEVQIRNLNEMNKSRPFWNIRTVKSLMQGTQINFSPNEGFSKTRKVSMQTLMEDIKPVYLVTYQF